MLTWEDLLKFNRNPPEQTLIRTKDVQDSYDQVRHLNQNLTEILFSNREVYRFIPNNYPYDVDAIHYVLWFNPMIETKTIYENMDMVEDIIKKEMDDKGMQMEYIFFKNYPKNSSILHIVHYHVFLQKN